MKSRKQFSGTYTKLVATCLAGWLAFAMFEQTTVENVMYPGVLVCIDNQSDCDSLLLYYLRELILGSGDKVQEPFRWGIPSYDSIGMCMYLQVRKGQIELAILNGIHMEDSSELLKYERQKRTRLVRLDPSGDMPKRDILALVNEARN